MKKYIFLLVVVLSFLGCEKEMMDYEGKDGVYFSVQEAPPSLYGDPEIWSHMDTTLIPFSLLLENDSTVRLKVRVMGDVVNYDRYFTVSVVDSLTTALVNEDYAPLEERYVITAGERDGFVEFTGFRQAENVGFDVLRDLAVEWKMSISRYRWMCGDPWKTRITRKRYRTWFVTWWVFQTRFSCRRRGR